MTDSGGWSAVLEEVRRRVGAAAYKAWFSGLDGVVEGDQLILQCPDRFSRDWIERRYGEHIQAAAGTSLQVAYRTEAVRPTRPTHHAVQAPSPVFAARSFPASGSSIPSATAAQSDPRSLFDSFVPGPGSALALEAARAVAGGRAGRCSPLFINAATGLGKSHLCQAIRDQLGSQATYRSSEEFTSEVTTAMRHGQMDKIRRRFRRSANVLILEDVQFLRGKKQTQIELFHTLDHLLSRSRPVVLSGDCPPHQLEGLDPKLVSRMASGLIASITPPELEGRQAILREKAARGGVRIPPECLEVLAQRSVTSVRDLVSGLNQVVARASLLRRPISIDLVEEALLAVEVPGRPRSIEEIMRVVAKSYELAPDDLRSPSRRRRIVRPRQFAMYLCRRYTDASLKDIGRAFSRDHSSVMYAVDVVERRVAETPALRYELEALAKRMQVHPN